LVGESAREHCPAYSSDGDYVSKPSRGEIVRAMYSLIYEADPHPRSSLDL